MMELSIDSLDVEKYNEQLEYFNLYYGSTFKTNQGTEEILDVVNKYSKDGKLIDFGSGSNIFFWLIAFKQINSVLCVDISKEAFYINERIKNKELYPVSCDYPLKKYDKNFEDVLKINVDYLICDVFKEDFKIKNLYDNVTQFGLLGLCKTEEEYTRNLTKLLRLVNRDGVLIGANWCFSDSYANKMGFANKYLSEELIKRFAQKNNCNVLFNKMLTIDGDKNYNYVLTYVLKK